MQTNNYNYATLFVWNPRTSKSSQYNNATGSPVTLAIGTVMGRIFSTGYIIPMISSATDGSQVPIGVIAQTVVMPANTVTNVTLFIQGDVVADGLVFANSTDTLATNLALATSGDIIGTIRDVLTWKGMIPVPSTENTYYDNQA